LKERLLQLINDYPIFIGGLFLITGIIFLFLKIEKKWSFKMKDYDVMSWKAMVNSWALIVMLISGGLFIIFQQ